jgi:hypothetical protein
VMQKGYRCRIGCCARRSWSWRTNRPARGRLRREPARGNGAKRLNLPRLSPN